MRVDRQQRDLLVAAIDRYLNDEMTAFSFDDAIFEIRDRTDDETIQRVVDELWCFYDDCDDHKVVLDRLSWDYLQRLRLLLKSDAVLEISKRHIWSSAQAVAAFAIVGFLWAASWLGVGQQLLAAAIPFGVVSIALSKWRTHLFRAGCKWNVSLMPFSSIAQLLRTRRRVPGFRKQHYPSHLASRRVRGAGGALVNALHMYPFWLMLSPVVLLAQLLPVSVKVHRVVP
jgi:hypothetical protein